MKMNDIKKENKYGGGVYKRQIFLFVYATLTIVAWQIKSDLAAEEQLTVLNSFVDFTRAFQDYDIFTVLLIPVVFAYAGRRWGRTLKKRI